MSEERLLELLADRATEGLGIAETAELERLLVEFPEVDDLEFDLAAGAIETAFGPEVEEELPAALRSRIEADAAHFVAVAGAERPEGTVTSIDTARRRPWIASAGWLAAAGLAGVLLLRGGAVEETPVEVAIESPVVEEQRVEAEIGPALDASALRAELLAGDAVKIDWSATGDAAGPEATGDVVWSNERQAGVMRFRGLAANDPTSFQYQLWIFDATRDERYPVDGGVFDISRDGEDVLVAIDPRLPVDTPTLFAVTVEQPGGVVVSSRERIAVVATVEAAPIG